MNHLLLIYCKLQEIKISIFRNSPILHESWSCFDLEHLPLNAKEGARHRERRELDTEKGNTTRNIAAPLNDILKTQDKIISKDVSSSSIHSGL